MLLNFSLKNVLSYKDEFDLNAKIIPEIIKKLGGKQRLINNLSVLEENDNFAAKNILLMDKIATGKTNILKALCLLKSLILKPTRSDLEELNYQPFSSKDVFKEKPTEFEITFCELDQVYRYSLKYLPSKVIYEKLEFEEDKFFKTYFERNEQNFDVPENMQLYVENVRKNSLLLFFAQSMNDKLAKNVYKWFDQNLIFASDNLIETNKILELLKDETNRKLFIEFFKTVDIQIEDILLEERFDQVWLPSVGDSYFSQTKTTIKSYYFDLIYEDKQIPISNESKNIQKLANIFLAILLNKKENKLILIDDFNLFEDSLTLKLAKLFATNEFIKSNQFVLVTNRKLNLDQF